MQHLGTTQLQTERLILRRFLPADAEAMYRNWASDPEVTRFLTWPPHANVNVSRWVVNDWISHYKEKDFYQWAMVPKELGEPIGTISVVAYDDRMGKIEVGYCIGKQWWHRGYMTEALGAVIHFFFEEVGSNRVQACHDTNNPNSGLVMRKCGMTFEGIQRQAGWNNCGVCDVAWYAILAEDGRKTAEMEKTYVL